MDYGLEISKTLLFLKSLLLLLIKDIMLVVKYLAIYSEEETLDKGIHKR